MSRYNPETVKEAMRRHGWTVITLAERMRGRNTGRRVSPSCITQLINGNPTVGKLYELADAMGISVAELLTGYELPCDVPAYRHREKAAGRDSVVALVSCGGDLYRCDSRRALAELCGKLDIRPIPKPKPISSENHEH